MVASALRGTNVCRVGVRSTKTLNASSLSCFRAHCQSNRHLWRPNRPLTLQPLATFSEQLNAPNADRHDQMPPGLKFEVRELLFWAAVVAVICLIAFIVMLAE